MGALVFVRFGGPAYTPSSISSVRHAWLPAQFSPCSSAAHWQEDERRMREAANSQMQLQEDFVSHHFA
ncbi:MAG: hypothetical protein M0C28_33490 [Candidatus Moduliflexus flocculans]|nr:hypothetical protein [Candidatus Moduliflexus flocculans]